MENSAFKSQRLLNYTLVLAFLVLLYIILDQLRFYLVPAVFGGFLAMLMLPLNRTLERLKVHRVLAIFISLFIIFVVIVLLISLLTRQVISFANDLPTLQEHLTTRVNELREFVTRQTGWSDERQTDFLNKEAGALLQSAGKWATGILVSTGGTLAGLTLVLVHYFLILLYRGRIKNFLLMLLPDEGHNDAARIIEAIAKVTQKYLTGVVTVMIILSILNSIGLLIIGVPNAIFFGILAAMLNVVPYIGVWIGSALPVFMALVSFDGIFYPVAVVLVFVITQAIDNNFLTPRITGSQVKINALAAIGIIIIGNMVWGVLGMILFMPLFGMLKIIFDNVEALKPIGYLIGDEEGKEQAPLMKRLSIFKRGKK